VKHCKREELRLILGKNNGEGEWDE
jgi:hypothetical protein